MHPKLQRFKEPPLSAFNLHRLLSLSEHIWEYLYKKEKKTNIIIKMCHFMTPGY